MRFTLGFAIGLFFANAIFAALGVVPAREVLPWVTVVIFCWFFAKPYFRLVLPNGLPKDKKRSAQYRRKDIVTFRNRKLDGSYQNLVGVIVSANNPRSSWDSSPWDEPWYAIQGLDAYGHRTGATYSAVFESNILAFRDRFDRPLTHEEHIQQLEDECHTLRCKLKDYERKTAYRD